MDDRRLSELASRQGGVVTTRQILACGLSSSGTHHRVATFRLFPVRHAAYTLGPHHDETTHLWAVVLTVDHARACVSHWSAVRVHGLGSSPGGLVHVTVPGTGGRRIPGVVVHAPRTLPPSEIVVVGGLRVTSPARTVLDVAARSGDDVVRRLIREAEYQGLLPAGEMLRVAARHPHHPGAARVRRVDPATPVDALTQTALEDELETLIGELPLPVPRRQFTVPGISGTTYRLDFAVPELLLAVEADGRSAHERASALETDRYRDNDLAATGWLTMRFTRRQIRRGRADAGRQLVAAAAGRGRRS